jgi:hypothetical protein
MIKSTIKLTLLVTTAVALAASPVLAAEKTDAKPKKEAANAPKAEASGRVVPFRGKITAKTDASITIGERTIEITSDTKIVKNGKPATLADAAVGDEVGGQYRTENNKMIARSLRIGPKPEGADKEAPKKSAAGKKEGAEK